MQPRLYTFTLSHFSEKVRWSLEESRVAFTEVPWTPFFHVLRALPSGRTTVPIFEVEGKRIQDSTRILRWLAQGRAPLSLMPADDAEHPLLWDTEARFDRVGEHVVRYAYSRQLDDEEGVVRYWTIDSTPRERSFVRKSFPALRWVFRRKLRMSPRSVAASRAVIESGLDFIEQRLSAGHRYLVGDRLSFADVTAAALLAPLACPAEHPVYSTERYRTGIGSVTGAWAARPAFAWVRDTYRLHRTPSPRAAEIRSLLDS